MFEITVTNLITNRKYGARFNSSSECLDWHAANYASHGNENSIPQTARVAIIDITSQEITKIKNILLKNYSSVESINIGVTAAIDFTTWAKTGNLKAIANLNWTDNLWAEYRLKVNELDNGNKNVSLMPTSLWKPYTYNEIQNEIHKH